MWLIGKNRAKKETLNIAEANRIIQKLNSLYEELEELKQKHYSEGQERLYDIHTLLERIIYRIYPDKDAKRLINSMYSAVTIATSDDAYNQREFITSIERAQRTIRTIKEESELFGFEDFKPLKEKIEEEYQIGSDKFGFWRKKRVLEK